MSEVYTPTAVVQTTLLLPSGGDLRNTGSVNGPFKKLADGIKYLTDQLGLTNAVVDKIGGAAAVSGMGSLAALSVSGIADGAVRFVAGVGAYVLSKDAGNITLFGDPSVSRTPHYIMAASNAGVWMLCSPHLPTTQRISALGHFFNDAAAATISSVSVGADFVGPPAVVHTTYGFRTACGSEPVGQYCYLCDLTACLAGYRGMRLKEAKIRIYPGGGHSGLPEYMPRLGVFRQSQLGADVDAATHLAAGFEIDASADVTAYEQNHFLRLTTTTANIIEDGYTYALLFCSEGGTDAVADIYVAGLDLNLGL